MRDRVRTKMERNILADIQFPFIVSLYYGKKLDIVIIAILISKIREVHNYVVFVVCIKKVRIL